MRCGDAGPHLTPEQRKVSKSRACKIVLSYKKLPIWSEILDDLVKTDPLKYNQVAVVSSELNEFTKQTNQLVKHQLSRIDADCPPIYY